MRNSHITIKMETARSHARELLDAKEEVKRYRLALDRIVANQTGCPWNLKTIAALALCPNEVD